MLLDNRLMFSDGQALTATAVSTNVINLRSVTTASAVNANPREVGAGEQIYWVTSLDVAADGTSADETYTATLQTDDNEAFSSATTVDVITIVRGSAAGTRYIRSLPSNGIEQFLRVNYTLGGTTPSVTVVSGLSLDAPVLTLYNDAI